MEPIMVKFVMVCQFAQDPECRSSRSGSGFRRVPRTSAEAVPLVKLIPNMLTAAEARHGAHSISRRDRVWPAFPKLMPGRVQVALVAPGIGIPSRIH